MEIQGGLVVTQKNELQTIFNRSLAATSLILLSLLYLTNEFYSSNHQSFCDLSETFSCTALKNSAYSKLFGVPVAVFGLVYYAMLFYTYSKAKGLGHDTPQGAYYLSFAYYWLSGGVTFIVYLIIAEISLLTICPVCTLLHILHVYLLFTTYSQLKTTRRRRYQLIDVIIEFKLSVVVFAVVCVLLIFHSAIMGGVNEGNGLGNERVAECVTNAGWKMIGSSSCDVCARQKKEFSSSAFSLIDFLDCAVDPSLCTLHGISVYPTWILFDPSNPSVELYRWEGFASLSSILLFSNCSPSLLH